MYRLVIHEVNDVLRQRKNGWLDFKTELMALVVLGLNPDSIKLKRTISSFDKKLISVQCCSLSLKVYCRHGLDDPVVSRYLVDLHNHCVIVPADKAPNNVVFICKAFYYSCLRKELDDSDKRNASSTYQRTNLT